MRSASRVWLAVVASTALIGGCAGPGSSGTSATPAGSPTVSASPSSAATSASPAVSASAGPSASAPADASRIGLDWVRVPAGPSLVGAAMSAVAAAPGGLLAVGSLRAIDGNSLVAWVSRDGITWQMTNPHPGARGAWADDVVALADGWVIVGATATGETEAPRTWTSADGAAWTGRPVDGPVGLSWPVVAGGRIVAFSIRAPIGGMPTDAWSSADLADWETRPLASPGFAYLRTAISTPDGGVLATGRLTAEPVDVVPFPLGSQTFWSSADGLDWTATPGGEAFDMAWIEALAGGGPGGYAALGCRRDPGADPDVPSAAVAWWSADGLEWTEATVSGTLESCSIERIVGVPDRWIALAQVAEGGTAVVATSEDGRAWSVPEAPFRFAGTSIADVVAWGDALVAVGATDGSGEAPAAAVWISR